MCNINIIHRIDGETDSKMGDIMKIMSYNSYIRNDDGDGFFWLTDNGWFMRKAEEKQKITIDNAYFIASHQRLSTGGKGVANVHPFETKNFVLMHNGHFSGYTSTDAESDTLQFVKELQTLVEQQNTELEEGKIEGKSEKTIGQLAAELAVEKGGSYSVYIFDKQTNESYYFKNNRTQMYACTSDTHYVMSTSEDNVEFVRWMLDMESEVFKIKENIVWDMSSWESIYEFEPEPVKTSSFHTKNPYAGYSESERYGSVYGYGSSAWSEDESLETFYGRKSQMRALTELFEGERSSDEEGEWDTFYRTETEAEQAFYQGMFNYLVFGDAWGQARWDDEQLEVFRNEINEFFSDPQVYLDALEEGGAPDKLLKAFELYGADRVEEIYQ